MLYFSLQSVVICYVVLREDESWVVGDCLCSQILTGNDSAEDRRLCVVEYYGDEGRSPTLNCQDLVQQPYEIFALLVLQRCKIKSEYETFN